MKTIKEISKMAGISVRTLQYYDKIGLLKPGGYSVAGYRLYSDKELRLLRCILMFRELGFSLKEIKRIINEESFNRNIVLEQQINLLSLKKERLENLILLAEKLKSEGGDNMDFYAFDTEKIERYTSEAKKYWGSTKQFKEFEEREKTGRDEERKTINQQLMMIFSEFADAKSKKYDSKEVQMLVKKLQNFITDNFYKCSKEILLALGKMYVSEDEFTKNIDEFAGKGTAAFVNRAIEYYCK